MSDHVVMESEGARPSNWIWAVVAAVVSAVVATWLTGLPVATALLFGAVVFVVYAVVLAQFWEEPASGDHDHGHGHDDHGHDAHGSDGHAGHAHESQAAPIAVAVPVAAAAPVVTATPLAPVTEPAPGAAAAGSAPVALETSASGEAVKPVGLAAPRGGKADALQEIEGVGPAMEKLAHELGIYHFDQIAAWGEAEIAWMDGNLKGFKGRVTRDKWVAQAKIIVTEGVEAFRVRAKTNDY